MNKNLLNKANQSFINENLQADIASLALKKLSLEGVSLQELVQQVEAKKKCEKKLPTWFSTEEIYYPKKLSIEQSSSETTAAYKAGLVNGKTLIDLTGGFGVDCVYFSKKIDTVIHCELNEELSKIVSYNLAKLSSVSNVKTVSQDGLKFLEQSKNTYDWSYIDPARRDDAKGKVFLLKDCLPNVVDHLDLLFKHSDHILIKASPMLDIKAGLKELDDVKEIHVVAVNNEVKELLWLLEKGTETSPIIKTINIEKKGDSRFDFVLSDEAVTTSTFSLPKIYLYEPNTAIMKAGGFSVLSKSLEIQKLHRHTHLYTSDSLINFPGRRFMIEEVFPNQKKLLKGKLKGFKANITVRNYPDSVATIRKKFGVKDGGEHFLFFTTDKEGKKMVLRCKKVQ